MLNDFIHLQKVFSDKMSFTDSSYLRCKHFMHFISDSLSKVKKINYSLLYEILDE